MIMFGNAVMDKEGRSFRTAEDMLIKTLIIRLKEHRE